MQKDSTDPGKIKREGKKGRKKGKEGRVWKGGEEEKKEKRFNQKNISVEKVVSLRRNLAINGRNAGIENLNYHFPDLKTAGLHWKRSCRCRQENASWTSWSGGDAFVTECTPPSPLGLPSADQSQSGYR